MINAKVGAERITRFLAEPETESSTGSERIEHAPLGFVMENLSVHLGRSRYPSLRDVSLSLRPGESLAVVGPVGSGKSTFIHAILGEVEFSSGRLHFVDGAGGVHTRARIGYVPQEAYILNGSLRENLTFGNAGISAGEIDLAVRLAGLEADLRAMPAGLETEIGEKGINLSGGQRQRLSLARAILHRPQLVVLDDPLSAVDPAMEDHLASELIFGAWRGLSRVAITHRLGHLEKFDRIAFLEGGRLLAVGGLKELQRTCPEFRAYIEEYTHAHSVGAPEAKAEAAAAMVTAESSRITEDEDREFGAVRGGVYRDYVMSLAGENPKTRGWILALLALTAASGTILPLAQKAWLAFVSTRTDVQPLHAIYVYGALGLLVMAGAMFSDLFWLKRGLAAGRQLHEKMLSSVLGAQLRFFDATPVGRVLQRFSRDMEAIDIQLQWAFENSMKCFASVVITLVLIFCALPAVIVFVLPVLALYYRVQKLYRASAREAKRLDSIGRSPRYAHFKETLQGLVVIRAYGKRDWFMGEFYKRLNHSQRMFHGHYMINRWFSSRIPVIGGLVSLFTVTAIALSARAGTLSPGLAGLLTIYSLSFWGVLNWGIRIWAEVEARMTSMERVKFYSRLPQEVPVLNAGRVPEDWPSQGEVRFEHVYLRYAAHLPLVLNDLSFSVEAGTKVGIVGRTGSGKSTLFQALYRFTEVENGRILIDGVDIASVPLPRLRKALAVIPQDPTLFMGTLRENLDRNGEFSDGELWRVLHRVSLGEFVRSLPDGLRAKLNENGCNLSQGQRQLVCLARALLMRAKVIILDEATASVDVKTDAQVQAVLRESCRGLTLLIIAHRLGTVKDCDQILEIAQGRLRRRLELAVPARSAPVTPIVYN
jgi:ABC-type multidrug transport system fused ATPase/permease subunit